MKKTLSIVFLAIIFWTGFANVIVASNVESSLNEETLSEAEVSSNTSVVETLEGKVISIIDQQETEDGFSQTLEIEITKGSQKGDTVTVENSSTVSLTSVRYKISDKIQLEYNELNGQSYYFIVGYVRRGTVILLTLIFVAFVVIIGGLTGVRSIISLVLSFVIIFSYTLPQIYNGKDPLFVSIITAVLCIPITFYVAHGFKRKTTVAVISTIVTLVLTVILAQLFISATHLTGLGTEDAALLLTFKGGDIDVKSLIIAGIVISVIGVIDDIAIAQVGFVESIKKSNPKIKTEELYKQSIQMGRDHIASMINTLVLVYAGGSLSTLLLIIDNPKPISEFINYEFLVDQIVRTLVGSLGLVIGVPITTFAAMVAYDDNIPKEKNEAGF
ncbi:YibE/F family protein [Candidatus Dojkabacteria bacterium]|nr:YibE/F family protein [Candidatus Dojkabacteria bacterium]